jgi:hypothetical protein
MPWVGWLIFRVKNTIRYYGPLERNAVLLSLRTAVSVISYSGEFAFEDPRIEYRGEIPGTSKNTRWMGVDDAVNRIKHPALSLQVQT